MTIKFEFTDEEMAGILSLTHIGAVYIARNYMEVDEDKAEVAKLELSNIEKDNENQILRFINGGIYDKILEKIDSMQEKWLTDLKKRVEKDKKTHDVEKMPTDEDVEK